MADVEAALAQAAAEDGGALFECRPRGLPPGKLGRILAVVVIVAPFLSGWWDVAALRLRGRDHARRWSGDWSYLWLHVDDERGATHSKRALGPGWGPSSPLLKGVDVPWLLLGAVGFASLELLRLATYRSRRIAVTRTRVLVAEGIVGVHVVAWARPEQAPTLHVRRGDVVLRSTRALHLGRLDPLDLVELAATVGAGPHRPSPRSRRWRPGLAVAALAGVLLLLGLTRPWSGSVRIERGAGSLADQVTLSLDGSAWGPRRTLAPLHDRSSAVVQRHVHLLAAYLATGDPSDLSGLPRPDRHFVACVVEGLEADEALVQWQTHALQGATNGALRREEVTSLQLLEDATSPPWGHARRKVAPARLRVVGHVRLVDGEPIPFDVTLDPGESVTLDLADLHEQAR